MNFLKVLFHVANNTILIYFILINFFYLLFLGFSFVMTNQYRQKMKYLSFKEIFHLPHVKPISIIVPIYNEENTVIESVKSLLCLEYPRFEVIAVNDGSTDKTLENLIKAFKLKKVKWVFRKSVETKPVNGIYKSIDNPKLIVIDKINGKKADALNAGLNISRYPLFCAIDGDSILEKDALLKMVRPFLEYPEKTIASGGILRLSNGCTFEDGQIKKVGMPKNFLARIQIIEYFRAFLGGRMGLNAIRSLLIISGAFGLFRKDVTLACGGYRKETIGEDMDLIVRIKKYLCEKKASFRIHFIPDPICWTEAPETFSSLMNQRNRWHRGLIETLFHNRKMIFNPFYGPTGLFAMPFYLIFEFLGPIIELLGYGIFAALLFTGQLNHPFLLLFFLVAVFSSSFISLFAILLEEYSFRRYPKFSDILIISLFSLLENFVYRQSLSFIRTKAVIDCIKGKKGWGEMKKIGFSKKAEQP